MSAKEKETKIIFLDVDGVLNDDNTNTRTPDGYTGVDEKYIKNLKRIVDRTGAEIVLSSDWKFEYPNGPAGRYLKEQLEKEGLKIKAKTPGDSRGRGFTGRGGEILAYLKKHPEVRNFVILDDNRFRDFQEEPCSSHFVYTLNEAEDSVSGWSFSRGLSGEKVEEAVKILESGESSCFQQRGARASEKP